MEEKNNYQRVLKNLKSYTNKVNIAGMARFGINSKNTLGIKIPILRKIAKEIGKNHALALQLWNSKIHEARILASMIDDAKLVKDDQAEKWARDFDSWDVCDQVCMNLFDKTPFAYQKALQWSKDKLEFVKRAGFVLMACLSIHDKTSKDKNSLDFLKVLRKNLLTVEITSKKQLIGHLDRLVKEI